jgi:2Fe-2S ferredoxin
MLWRIDLAKITYVEANGARHVVEVPPGWSLMEGAVKNGVPGIVADCGGSCSCGTCRIYLDEHWQQILGAPSEIEDETLDIFEDATPGKRLSCQIKVTSAMDGMEIQLPERQF